MLACTHETEASLSVSVLSPTVEQQHLLARTFGCARYIYNWALRLRTDAYYKHQQRIGYHETSAQLTLLKQHFPLVE